MQAAFHQRKHASAFHQRLRAARRAAIAHELIGQIVSLRRAGLRSHHQIDRVILNVRSYQHLMTNRAQTQYFVAGEHRFHRGFVFLDGPLHDGSQILPRRILDQDLHQEAVELGFGKRIGSFHLDRILRGHHKEGRIELEGLRSAGDGVFLHGLEQRGLGLRRRAINLIGQHQMMGEDRARRKAKLARAVLGIDDHAADNVSRHEVGSELDARVFQVQDARQGPQQRGLAQAGHTLEEHVSAREQTNEDSVDDILLTNNDLADFRADAVKLRRGKLESGIGLHGSILSQAYEAAAARGILDWISGRSSMRPAMSMAAITVLTSTLAIGQAAETLKFEVASVKRSTPGWEQGGVYFGPARGGPGSSDPERITWSYPTLRTLLMTAYDVKAYQVTGPAWLDTERYDIVANVPAGTTREQLGVMWQNLLIERFRLVLHHESKEFQVEELVIAKGGSKLKETAWDPATPLPPGPPQRDAKGALSSPGMVTTIFPDGPRAHTIGKAQPLSQLTAMMTNQLRRPVLDKTGLTGRYDFDIEYTPDLTGFPLPPGGPAAPGDSAAAPIPDLAAALQQQLGLRLVASKAMLDVVVIDQAEKVPTEN